VYLLASPHLAKSLGKAAIPEDVVLQATSSHGGLPDQAGCLQLVVCAGKRPRRCSRTLFVVVLPAAILVRSVCEAAEREGQGGAAGGRVVAEVAEAAARALAPALEEAAAGLPPTATRLLVVEGLRAAVLAVARGAAAAAPAAGGVRATLLPHLLGMSELTVLALDLRYNWHIRVHETRAAETTMRFIRTLARVSIGEAALPFAAA